MKAPAFAALAALFLASGCATTATSVAGYEKAREDPWEGFNRDIYSFNEAVDGAILKPAAQGYRDVLPGEVRQGIGNAFDNIDEPLSFVNALLQGKIKRAFRAVDRFAINTTYGFLGTTDRAAELGLPKQPEDFGQTLAVWGVPSGPYLVLPIFGPSTVRDAGGLVLNNTANPWGYYADNELNLPFEAQAGMRVVEVIDLRAGLLDTADTVLENALDPYATQRSAYLQARLAEILNESSTGSDGGAFEGMEEFEPLDFEEEPEPDSEILGEEPLSPQQDPDG